MKLQFDLQNNYIHISEKPLDELKISLLSDNIKAIFLMSGQVNPNRCDPHLKQLVRWWPPYYLPVDQFVLVTGRLLTRQEKEQRANAQRQPGTPVLPVGSNAILGDPAAMEPEFRLLIANDKGYTQLVCRLFDCLLGYLNNELTASSVNRELFHEIYAKPNVLFNFLHHMGFSTFWLDKWHSYTDFLEAYHYSAVCNYMESPDKSRGTPLRVMERSVTLSTHQARVEYIKQWYQEFCTQFPKHVEICSQEQKKYGLESVGNRITASFEDQVALLALKLNAGGDLSYFQWEQSVAQKKQTDHEQKVNSAKVGQLTKMTKE